MANTFVKIASVTVGSGGAANMTFSSIPSTYTDLVIKISSRDTRSGAGSNTIIGFNGSTSNFSFRRLIGDSSTAASDTAFGLGVTNGDTSTASTFANFEVYVPNYASANNKGYSVDAVSENNGTTAYQQLTAGLWSQTTAISSVNLYPSSGNNWMQYTTATLYGIKNS